MVVWGTYAVNFLLTSAVDAARAADGTPPPTATAPRRAAPKVLRASDREHAPSCAALMTTLRPSESGQRTGLVGFLAKFDKQKTQTAHV